MRTIPRVLLVSALVCFATLVPLKGAAQSLDWVTAVGGAEGGYGNAFDVALDGDGNVFVVGGFLLDGDFDGDGTMDVADAGFGDGFLAKYSASGSLLWVVATGGPGIDQARGVAVDVAGNSYVTGFLQSDADFDGDGTPDITIAGLQDFFVASYDNSGVFQWARAACGTGDDITTGGTDYVFVAGQVGSCADFDGDGTPDVSGAGPFVAAYSTSGAFRWFRFSAGGVGETATGVGTDSDGNVYYTGGFFQSADFSGDGIAETFSNTAASAFLAKYAADGTYQWVRTAGSLTEDARALDISVVADGASFVVGTYAGTADFNGDGTPDVPASTFGSGFVVRYDAAGDMQWVRAIGGTPIGEAHSVAASTTAVYVGGYFEGGTDLDGDGIDDATNVVISHYDADGVPQRAISGSGANPDDIAGIALDASGDIYVAGLYTLSMDLDGDSTIDVSSARGSFEPFAAKLRAAGATSIEAATPNERRVLSTVESNFPNPFSGSTVIRFTVYEAGNALLAIYDVTGRKVDVVFDRFVTPGTYETAWGEKQSSAVGRAAGILFARLTIDGQTTSRLMVRVP